MVSATLAFWAWSKPMIPIPPPLVAHLKAWIKHPPSQANRDTELVICNRRGDALESRHIAEPLRAACTRAGLDRVTAYTLRHLSVRTCEVSFVLASTTSPRGESIVTDSAGGPADTVMLRSMERRATARLSASGVVTANALNSPPTGLVSFGLVHSSQSMKNGMCAAVGL